MIQISISARMTNILIMSLPITKRATGMAGTQMTSTSREKISKRPSDRGGTRDSTIEAAISQTDEPTINGAHTTTTKRNTRDTSKSSTVSRKNSSGSIGRLRNAHAKLPHSLMNLLSKL